jgi:histidine triad (HIT) family protein
VDTNGCVFCEIVAGVCPARVVLRDEHAVAFLDRGPAARGHTLVVPRVHVRTLAEAPREVAGWVFAAASDVARLLTERLAPDGLTVVQSNEHAGWQDVFHLHVHVVPRWDGDSLIRPWSPVRADSHVLDAVHAELTR